MSTPPQPKTGMYGLPLEVAFCKRCIISNQRPSSSIEFTNKPGSAKHTIQFDAEGICSACRYAEKKKTEIDWAARERELVALCDKYRSDDGSYDCLVPGSGGKDSFMAAHLLKYKYGMHPLTVTWAPHIYTDWGWKNFQSWIHAGFDNYLCTPNGRIHRLLTRLALENLFHPFQPFILGQKNLAPKMAAKYNIKLVFYGENEAEYGNPAAENTSAVRDWKYFTSNKPEDIYLGGVSLKELDEKYGVKAGELEPYLPPNPEESEKLGIQIQYLGYYLPWHPQGAYYYSVEHGGFIASPERTPGTYSKYNSIDDKMDDFNFITMFTKFGIGRATYDAAQEVRNGEITREEGVALVRRFDGEWPERFADELFEYLSLPEKEFPEASKALAHPQMDKDYFMQLADKFRPPHLWEKTADGWKLRTQVS